jgi:hypothetical protein
MISAHQILIAEKATVAPPLVRGVVLKALVNIIISIDEA